MILRGVARIKLILWLLVILRGVYGVMGPLSRNQESATLILQLNQRLPFHTGLLTIVFDKT